MAQAWFQDGGFDKHKTSEAYFRKCPFGGSYLIAAGLGEFLSWIENWKFTDEHIKFLRNMKGDDDKPMFTEDFLEFIRKQNLRLDIASVREGEIVFPNEPVLAVTGPSWQVDMVEAAFLNIFNMQSLVATKASRVAAASQVDGVKRPVLEFGLRRAQELGGFSPTRASFIGGCFGTSNVAAGQYYNIPIKGTMAHSFVMSYESETRAFKAFLKSAKGNSTLLVDTYDTRQGVKNAVKASDETGIKLNGIRIDSGDLAYWSKEARKILDAAGFSHTKIVLSNDLDEHVIENLIAVQKADVDIIAAGTKLVTAYDSPALGGVFKTKSFEHKPVIKIADGKTTIPGATNILRIYNNNGMFRSDVITSFDNIYVQDGVLARDIISLIPNSPDEARAVFPKGSKARSLLENFVIGGNIIKDKHDLDLHAIKSRAAKNMELLEPEYKRLANPHIYNVGIEQNLAGLQLDMVREYNQKRPL
jgi:nicotinate phosphoribosyltransferase